MLSRLKDIFTFIRVEALSGVLLIIATIFALIFKNSSLSNVYNEFIHAQYTFQYGPLPFTLTTHQVVNDLLMTIFFLLVGLEIKREYIQGDLSDKTTAVLPTVCAIGGMGIPALVYIFFSINHPESLRGWAIPSATDIAFSLGVLSLFGRKVPVSLKIFLTALAIIDDLFAILVIAFFYSSSLNINYLLLSALTCTFLYGINRRGYKRLWYYFLPGALLFVFILNSGIHATIAGVLIALFIPIDGQELDSPSPLIQLEHNLHPWVAFGILPLFAFTNSGIDIKNLSLHMLINPITLGCLLGLFLGKQLGVMTTAFIALKYGVARLPDGVTWRQFYGVSILTGIGFTMSLFVGGLAFSDLQMNESVKLGVLIGSLLSGIFGALILLSSPTIDLDPSP